MGLFDSLLNAGKKALNDAAAKEIADKLDDTLGGVMKNIPSAASGLDTDTFGKEASSYNKPVNKSYSENQEAGSTAADSQGLTANKTVDKRPFDAKLREITAKTGLDIETRSVSPDELEKQFGQSIYTRSGCYALPDKISYKLVANSGQVLYIRLWSSYAKYNHAANRQIKEFCDSNGVKMLDFFEYMPNEFDYMEQRIQNTLG